MWCRCRHERGAIAAEGDEDGVADEWDLVTREPAEEMPTLQIEASFLGKSAVAASGDSHGFGTEVEGGTRGRGGIRAQRRTEKEAKRKGSSAAEE